MDLMAYLARVRDGRPKEPGLPWYVRPSGSIYGAANGTSYDDAWAGFAAIQWASIQPGDTLYVAGTHHQTILNSYAFSVGASGVSGSPITIASCETAYGASTDDAGAIWAGILIPTTGWTGPTNNVYSRTQANYNTPQVEDGGNVLVAAADLAECEATAGSYYAAAGVLYYHPTDALLPLHFGGYCAFTFNQQSYVTVRGLKLYKGAINAIGVVSINRELTSETMRGITIEDCEVAYGGKLAFEMTYAPIDGLTIRGCTVYDCVAGFYAAPASGSVRKKMVNVTIENNEFYHTANMLKRSAWKPSSPGDELAIGSQGGIENLVIRGNHIHGWHGEGIFVFMGGYATAEALNMNGLIIDRNRVFMDPSVDGWTNSGIHIGGFNDPAYADSLRGAKVTNNVVSGCHYSTAVDPTWSAGLRIKSDPPTDPADTMLIANNTVYDSYIGVYAATTASTRNFSGTFLNNVISTPESGGYFIWHTNDAAQASISLDYNCYHGTGKWKWDGGADITSFASWQAAHAHDDSSVTGDPNFTNAGGNDFSIGASSSCLNVGTNTGLTDDVLGNPRPVGAYDIGAYERQ